MINLQKIGMFILVMGISILIITGVYYLIQAIIIEPGMPGIIKIGLIGIVCGIVVLFVSLIKERMEDIKNDKNKY